MDHKRILVFRIGHLGDTVAAIPALTALRETWPKAEITLLSNVDRINPTYVSPRTVLPQSGLVDDWMDYPSDPHLLDLLKLGPSIRRRRFDAVVYLAPRLRTDAQIRRDQLFFRASGVRAVLGVDYLKQNRLPAEIDRSRLVASEAKYLYDLVASIAPNACVSGPKMDMLLTEAEHAAARRFLDEQVGADFATKRLAAVAPGCKWATKVWPEQRFAEVIERLSADHDVQPVVVGGRSDEILGRRLTSDGAVAAGKLSIRESAALISYCDIFLGNDSGPMHLAAAVGTPIVAIFGANDWPGKWYPFGEGHSVFQTATECQGCKFPRSEVRHTCFDPITADEVYAACVEILSR